MFKSYLGVVSFLLPGGLSTEHVSLREQTSAHVESQAGKGIVQLYDAPAGHVLLLRRCQPTLSPMIIVPGAFGRLH